MNRTIVTVIFGLIGLVISVVFVIKFHDYRGTPTRDYYESGQLKSERFYKDGKQDGQSKEYYENGQLKSVRNFTDGKPDEQFHMYVAYSVSGKKYLCPEEDTWTELTRCRELPQFNL